MEPGKYQDEEGHIENDFHCVPLISGHIHMNNYRGSYFLILRCRVRRPMPGNSKRYAPPSRPPFRLSECVLSPQLTLWYKLYIRHKRVLLRQRNRSGTPGRWKPATSGGWMIQAVEDTLTKETIRPETTLPRVGWSAEEREPRLDAHPRTVAELVRFRAERLPEHPTVMGFFDEELKSVDGRTFYSKSLAVNARLHELGVGKGDRVALLSLNKPRWGICYTGVVASGAVVVPIDPLLTEHEY
ncbi:MAG: AMP-binding protein [Candidatus Coatesbacteria bacterium]|nr:AMP-binding protein [Candidatus Coatesbacteria bacterium]